MKTSVILLIGLSMLAPLSPAVAQSLEQSLIAEGPDRLAAEARRSGDAARGAVVFHQPYLACAKCHSVNNQQTGLGPTLSRLPPDATDAHLVESLLAPSKAIRKEYEPRNLALHDGRQLIGLVVREDSRQIVLRDAGRAFAEVSVPRAEIETMSTGTTSLMPDGQVNALTSRQQFLDLICYLIEIRDGGPARARQLQPSSHLIAQLEIPDYERQIDHAGMLRDLDAKALERGRAIYERLCINCHGTHDHPGSLPTSLRFAEGPFKNGSDPLAMYQTLTRGFGLMAPQTWMVPQQKYDVVHYIRETYLRRHNPSQYFAIDAKYLGGLPPGTSRGPAPRKLEPWIDMDYGPTLAHTYEVGSDASNLAYKGLAIRLDSGPGGVSRGEIWMVYDHDTLRVAAAWTRAVDPAAPTFIDWRGIQFDGQHQAHPRVAGQVHLANPTGPGWANPETGTFDDPRLRGRDNRPYGPLLKSWARFKGTYAWEDKTILSYDIGTTVILESPGMHLRDETIAAVGRNASQAAKAEGAAADAKPLEPEPVFTRSFNIGPRDRDLLLAVATQPDKTQPVAAGLSIPLPGSRFEQHGQRLCLRIPRGEEPLRFVLWCARDHSAVKPLVEGRLALLDPSPDLLQWTHGGRPRWPQRITTQAKLGEGDGPFAVDVLTPPSGNPWLAQMRTSGLDFFPDGDRMAVCTWDGDVWLVSGLSTLNSDADAAGKLTWQRIASGLFQPLGLKFIDGRIYLACRDQIVILNDLNGDGETDFYECFNNDHQVTEHFHEFAMGLQADSAGNLYYAKSARHALPALVPHHGTLLKVTQDGSRTEIVATGFRAANGVCLNADGTFVVTDQEGHWNPKNRINWVRAGGFYGNMFGYHNVTDASDAAMQQPLCWITNAFDRSPAELLWVDSPRWGPLAGSLLNLSYGYGKVYVVPHEKIEGQVQGGMCELPIPQFPTGVMRGRFHPRDGQLYLCGMFAWAGNQQQPGGLYRLRYTGKPVHLPLGLQATGQGMRITFSGDLSPAAAEAAGNYSVKVWSLKRTANYGSQHYDEHALRVAAARLAADGRTVFLELPELQPTWCMEIGYDLQSADGKPVAGVVHNTIHRLTN